MNDLPLVSVVVPSLNRARYLRQTLDSILGQDYPSIECIVVDAGSIDETLDILRSYGESIRWITRPDRGAFDAINDGWQMSRGEVLAWLNADDEWVLPGAVSAAVQFLQQHPETDVVYGDCGGIDAHGELIWYGAAREWDLEKAILYCDHTINQPAAFMRRSAVEQAGWLYPAWAHDHELWIRIALSGGSFQRMSVHLANTRIWAGNGHLSPKLFIPAKIATVERALADPRLPADLRRQHRRVLSNAYVRCLDFLPRPSQWPYGIYLILRAFLASPANLPYIMFQALVHVGYLVPGLRLVLQKRYAHGVTVRRAALAKVG